MAATAVTQSRPLTRHLPLVGFAPDRDYRYLEINRKLRALHPEIVADTVLALKQAGGMIVRDAETDLLTVNNEFTASLVLVRCVQTAAGSLRWKIRLDTVLKPDLAVAVRMAPGNESARDYYLLPRLDIGDAVLRLAVCLQQSPHREFGLSVLAANPAHHAGSLFRGYSVHRLSIAAARGGLLVAWVEDLILGPLSALQLVSNFRAEPAIRPTKRHSLRLSSSSEMDTRSSRSMSLTIY